MRKDRGQADCSLINEFAGLSLLLIRLAAAGAHHRRNRLRRNSLELKQNRIARPIAPQTVFALRCLGVWIFLWPAAFFERLQRFGFRVRFPVGVLCVRVELARLVKELLGALCRGQRNRIVLTGEHVRHQEQEQRNAQKRHPADGQIRFQQRPANHRGIPQEPHQQQAPGAEQPYVSKVLNREVIDRRQPIFAADILGQQDARRKSDQQQQIEIPQAPEPAELKEQRDRQQRRNVRPRRRIDRMIFEQDFGQSSGRRWIVPAAMENNGPFADP
jgi:hypothetical protein